MDEILEICVAPSPRKFSQYLAWAAELLFHCQVHLHRNCPYSRCALSAGLVTSWLHRINDKGRVIQRVFATSEAEMMR
jgi:hypothetical protein